MSDLFNEKDTLLRKDSLQLNGFFNDLFGGYFSRQDFGPILVQVALFVNNKDKNISYKQKRIVTIPSKNVCPRATQVVYTTILSFSIHAWQVAEKQE